jgi:hypothetical protein
MPEEVFAVAFKALVEFMPEEIFTVAFEALV